MQTYKHKIQVYETDNMGITHHSNYIRFMEEARVDFMEQVGFGYDKMIEQGVVSPVVAVSCDYKKTTTYPQVVEIEVSVLEMTALKVKIGYKMTSEGALVAKATSTHCFLSNEGRPVVIQDKFPELYEAFKSSMNGD